MSRPLAALIGAVVVASLVSGPASTATSAAPADRVGVAAGVQPGGDRQDWQGARDVKQRGESRVRDVRPRRGPTFNSPLGSSGARRAIFDKILRAVNNTPKGQLINVFSWNFLTNEGVDALLRAQRRGVRVRLVMDKINTTEISNPTFYRLRAGLKRVNRYRPPGRKSWARLCQGSCRGRSGSSHSKFYMFSKVGTHKRVVMQGSANFTVASTDNQWNDIYTHVGSDRVWEFFSRTFYEAAHDKQVFPAYLDRDFGGFRLIMFPSIGKAGRDPVMQLLNQVKCGRAGNTRSGRTRIRIAPDVIRQDRGMRLGLRVRQLWNRGCDIRIGYTVIGIDVGRMLRAPGPRGPVPLRHLVQDANDDGEFDNYFHLKAMSIVGHIGKDRSGYALLNGSANWSGLSRISDENLGIYRNRAATLAYQNHIDYWYDWFGGASARTSTSSRSASGAPLGGGDRLVFGTGPNAVYEDGTPYSTTGIDPYAHLDETD